MRKLAFCFAVLLCFAVSGVAQGTGGSSDTSASSTKTKKAKSSKAGGTHQVTGCLAGPNDEGVYTLTNGRYTKGLEVGGNDELKSHVGHEVTLTGTWASAADIGEKEGMAAAGEKKENEKAEKHLKVSSIKMVSDSCPAHAAKKTHKKGKAAPAT